MAQNREVFKGDVRNIISGPAAFDHRGREAVARERDIPDLHVGNQASSCWAAWSAPTIIRQALGGSCAATGLLGIIG